MNPHITNRTLKSVYETNLPIKLTSNFNLTSIENIVFWIHEIKLKCIIFTVDGI